MRLKLGRRAVLIVTGVVAGSGALLGMAASAQGELVMPGVKIGGIDVAGLNSEELMRSLRPAARAIEDRPLELVAGERSWTRSPEDFGFRVDLRASAETVLRAGRGNPFDWILQRLFGVSRRVAWVASIDRTRYRTALKLLAEEVNREAKSGEVRFENARAVVSSPQAGLTLLQSRLEPLLIRAVTSPRGSRRLALPVKVTRPQIGEDQVARVESEARRILSQPVEFRLSGRSFTLSPEKVAATLRTGIVTESEKDRAQLVLRAEPTALLQTISAEAPWGFRSPRDASFEVEGAAVRLVPAEEGLSIDAEVAGAAVVALKDVLSRTPIELVSRSLPPAFGTEAARALGITERVSTFTTVFDPRVAPRVRNIDLMARVIDGKIVRPGEEFSLNQATGERTPEKGYQVAQVIVDGELVPGLGGGVCQVGTTTFNAALLAGLEIAERHNHSLHISRYPLGRDATLNYGSLDLRFRNDTPHGLLLKAAVSHKSLTVSIYSTSLGRTVEFQTSPQRNFREPTTRYMDDPALPLGQEVVVEAGKRGFDVTVTRTIREGGKMIGTGTFVSRYRAWKRIVRRGTGPPAPSTPAPTLSPPVSSTESPPG